ncbi:uncharacterized protein LOC117555808 [Tachysurus ichikawai]
MQTFEIFLKEVDIWKGDQSESQPVISPLDSISNVSASRIGPPHSASHASKSSSAFEHSIENNTSSSQDRLYYLEQFTSGQPKELVRSCLHMGADRGYAEAKRLLELHFGDEFKITSAYIDKALNWNSIPSENGEALQIYTLSSWLL